QIDPTAWRGYHNFALDFLLNTPFVLDRPADGQADDYLLNEGQDLTQAEALEHLSVGAGSLPAVPRRPTPAPSDIPAGAALAAGVRGAPSTALPPPQVAAPDHGIRHTAAVLTRVPKKPHH